jgi:hypothetical protein
MLCNWCHEDGANGEIRDLFGSPYHPECYILCLPPHPGPEVDPILLKSERIVGEKTAARIHRDRFQNL